ncbi:MAG: hypothetical protein WA110_10675 [Anaerolineaceae bacterium]
MLVYATTQPSQALAITFGLTNAYPPQELGAALEGIASPLMNLLLRSRSGKIRGPALGWGGGRLRGQVLIPIVRGLYWRIAQSQTD